MPLPEFLAEPLDRTKKVNIEVPQEDNSTDAWYRATSQCERVLPTLSLEEQWETGALLVAYSRVSSACAQARSDIHSQIAARVHLETSKTVGFVLTGEA